MRILIVLLCSWLSTTAFAEEIVAVNWADALGKIDCKLATKDKVNGHWKINETLVVAGQRHENPTIDERDQISIIEKHCPSCPHTLTTLGVGC